MPSPFRKRKPKDNTEDARLTVDPRKPRREIRSPSSNRFAVTVEDLQRFLTTGDK
jgi:hypothetical protein